VDQQVIINIILCTNVTVTRIKWTKKKKKSYDGNTNNTKKAD